MGIFTATPTPPSDAACIARSRTDAQAFSTIVDRHFATVHRYLARRVGSDRADDLAAQAFAVAFRRRADFNELAASARPWLFGIATNVLRNELRAERRMRRFGGSVKTMRLLLAEALRNGREEARGFTTERTFTKCPRADLRTLVFGFAGTQAAAVAISGFGAHETESVSSNDDGFYLFVLAKHWNYGSKFQDIVTCQDGRTVSGVAAPGTPDAPYCR